MTHEATVAQSGVFLAAMLGEIDNLSPAIESAEARAVRSTRYGQQGTERDAEQQAASLRATLYEVQRMVSALRRTLGKSGGSGSSALLDEECS